MAISSKTKAKTVPSLIIWLFAALLLVLSGCGSAKEGSQAAVQAAGAGSGGGQDRQKQAPVTLNIADISTNPVLRMAVSKGFFEKHGIEAKLVTFATPAEGINSLFIKQADIAWGADFPILNAVSKGEFAIIASTGTSTEQNAKQWKLFVRDDIGKPEDLKGKKLSFLRGTFLSYLWDEYLAEHGLALDDVKLIGQGGSDEAYIALKKGEVDAVWVSGAALVAKFEAAEGVRQLTDMSQTKVRIGSQIVAPEALIRERPEAVANFLRALDEALRFVKENPQEVADILYKEVKQPRESTLKDLEVLNWNVDFTEAAYDSLTRQKKYMVENGIIEKDFELKDKIKLEFLREVLPDRVTITP
ncbi:ABC transporter substrate-binding protein [Paenibacillus sp. FSL R5-0527]|uniref:ABC transporter substrate-binding protein n=1 Tax=Paenibacillus sp. FSL R5-0527 TaxID=2975321 RepID=UPI00097AE12A|nr:nitrate ABC transporter substrate-binding protein [Paenibacillus macerans]